LKSITTHACELKILKRKGSLFYAQVISKLMQNSETDKPRILMFIYDISDQKKTHDSLHQHQVRLAHVDRLNSTNTLAAILAHEINNPIGVIINYINGCIHRLKNNSYKVDDLVNVLNRTSDQIKHIAEITLRLKNFSCKEQLQLESHCINEVIHEVIDFIYYETIDFPISITHRPLKYAKKILFDKIHIQQVILNLARNAIEAMQEAKIEDPKLIIETNLLNPSTIEISVNDNGPGISEYKHKLFDLHFTTKPYGTGLGLAVSRAIVEAHQGELSFENNHWNGASFKFTLRLKA
ncbi:MAG TPA: sensor histidine kinase, partial [Gammaproteobacteria bacterium]|nr:sensor histidine kinase [Gammaproteobacteria bacterium]